MFLQRLRLSSFRSYDTADIVFDEGINYIEGPNGSGKSNLLEAVYLLGTGKSFRTSTLRELIKYTQDNLALEAFFHKDGTDHKLSVFFSKEGRKIIYNETPHASFIPLFGLLPSVFLSPEDIGILSGGPAERRRFLDLHIAQADSNYLYHLGRYQKALKQRNFLLKTAGRGFAPWEELMAISACYIIEKRIVTISNLQKISAEFLLALSGNKEPLEIRYEGSLQENHSLEEYIKAWSEARPKELAYKTTLIGPHRDDVLFFVNGREMKSYSSEGQKRCCLAALRLAEWMLLKKRLDVTPLFGIDDFGVHLDANRTFILEELLTNMGQVFLTAPSFLKKRENGKNTHLIMQSTTTGM